MPVFRSESRLESGSMNPVLRELIESGQFDWDDAQHREMYLSEWVKGRLKEEGVSV